MFNLVAQIGNLTSDPKPHVLGNEKIAKISIAVNKDSYTDGQGQKIQPEPIYIPVDVHGPAAKFVLDYLKQGNKVAVKGEIGQYKVTDDQSGKKYNVTYIKTYNIENLTSRPAAVEGEVSAPASQSTSHQIAGSRPAQAATQQRAAATQVIDRDESDPFADE